MLSDDYVWTPAKDGDFLWAALDAPREITLNAPSLTNTPMRVTTALMQSATNGVGQVTWDGPVAASGGVAPSIGAEYESVDYFSWQWDGSRWVFVEASYSVEDL